MLWFFPLLFRLCHSNNVDVESPLVINGSQPHSLFGYSVLIHRLPNSNEIVYLVGAPRANTSQQLISPGAVYRCQASSGDLKQLARCEEWLDIFDSQNDNTIRFPTRDQNIFEEISTETKSGQFFGVSLVQTEDSVVGCANLYKDHYGAKLNLIEKRLPIGRCSVISSSLDEHLGFIHPCKDIADSHDSYGSCNAGASLSQHDGEVLISAPNTNYAFGNSFLYRSGADTVQSDILELMSSSWRGSIESMEDQIPTDYAGYSSVFCDVNGDGTKEVVLGMPRAYTYKGSIRVHFSNKAEEAALLQLIADVVSPTDDPRQQIGGTIDTTLYKNLRILCPFVDELCVVPEGPHMGSYFGHSLACGDLNGDGFDDLIVGAPYFSKYIQTNVVNDVGKVFVFYGNPKEDQWIFPFPDFEMKLQDELVGNLVESGGMFGYTLNTEGDLNSDGIADLVVGSPYEGEGQGAVYVFNGGQGFFDTRHSQKITPVQLRENLRGFGSAISSGYNIDGIAGHDLLLGSYLSDSVVMLRTIPTVEIKPILLLIHDVVNLEDPTFTDPKTGEMTVGNTLRIIIDTRDIQFPNENMQLNWVLILDPFYSDPLDKRAYTREGDDDKDVYQIEGSVVLQSNMSKILPNIVNIFLKRETIRNTKELYVDIEGSLEALHSPEYFSSKFALKYELFRSARVPIKIVTNCSAITSVCTSDVGITKLKVSAGPEEYGVSDLGYPAFVINHVENISVFVTLQNSGPDKAYDTTFSLQVPQHLLFYSFTAHKHDYVVCGKTSQDHIECKVQGPFGGPFPVGAKDVRIDFIVEIDENSTNFVHNELYDINATITVDTPSLDPNSSNNYMATKLHAQHLADIVLDGGSRQPTQFFTNHILPDLWGPASWEDIGPEVRHSITVAVDELVDVEAVTNLVLEVRWPLKKKNDYYLYLTDIYIPELFMDMVSCERDLVDQLNLAPAKPAPVLRSTPTLATSKEGETSKDITKEHPVESSESELTSSSEESTSSKGSSSPVEVSSSQEAEAAREEQLFALGGDASLDCTRDPCHVIKCTIPALHRGNQNRNRVRFEMKSRLWERTFSNNYRVNATSFSRIVSVGGDLVLPAPERISKQITSKFVLPSKRKGLNLWVIILAALAGLLILAIIILILWKRGFFKSTRFQRSPQNFYQTGARRETFDKNMFTAS